MYRIEYQISTRVSTWYRFGINYLHCCYFSLYFNVLLIFYNILPPGYYLSFAKPHSQPFNHMHMSVKRIATKPVIYYDHIVINYLVFVILFSVQSMTFALRGIGATQIKYVQHSKWV